jgi:nitrite reductase/ring-hydroxylating ferredoxin subunit
LNFFGVAVLPEFTPVCAVDDVAEGRGLALEVLGLRIAVFNDGGQFYALSGRCPHENGPLGLGWVEEGEAVCPLHQWRFKLATGRCTTILGQSIHRFACEIRDGQVWVAV